MGIQKREVGHRAWTILRLALLWARKGGVFKRRLLMEMRLLPKYLKRLAHTNTPPTPPTRIYYFERELSFDKTPIFRVKMHRPSSTRFHLPHIPCINPPVDFDYDFDDVDGDDADHHEQYEEEEEEEEEEEDEDEGIDTRAEEFIAKFYHQMKLQRQISYLQYNQTPNTCTS